jgi:hypothetical protein
MLSLPVQPDLLHAPVLGRFWSELPKSSVILPSELDQGTVAYFLPRSGLRFKLSIVSPRFRTLAAGVSQRPLRTENTNRLDRLSLMQYLNGPADPAQRTIRPILRM